jgi:hypothetical protein
MTDIGFVDSLPLWLLYLATFGIVLLSSELGWRYGDYRRRKSEDEKAPVGAAVGAILALLGFLLAFTFGMATSRFDTRKQIVFQEANAIGTAYLRSDFLSEEAGAEVRDLLREYTVLRSGGAAAILSQEGIDRAGALHERLWEIAVREGAGSNSVLTGLFVESLNDMIDLETVRLAASRNRIPDGAWLMLGVVAVLSMAAIGYQFGLTGSHSWGVMILLAIVFTTVFILIADLDRPQSGLLQITQQPLNDLLDRIGTPVP